MRGEGRGGNLIFPVSSLWILILYQTFTVILIIGVTIGWQGEQLSPFPLGGILLQ